MNKDVKLRILLVHASAAELFNWTGRGVERSHVYPANHEGHAALAQTLQDDARTPFFILVDCIEEDFRHDSIAHVGGSDRRELLKRKLKLQFRNTPYRLATIIGREKSGRRDDNVLFSALSNPELLDPWTDTLLRCQVPVKGITTPAYLMEAYAAKHKRHEEHLILISIEPTTGIRQTYLKNGKVMLSRLAPWVQEEAVSANRLTEQVVPTRKYLERIKLVPFDKPVKVLVFSSGLTDFSDGFSDTDELQYEIVEMAAQSALLEAMTDALKKRRMRNLYAPFALRRYFHINQVRMGLFLLSASTLLTTAALVTPKFLNIVDSTDRTISFRIQERPLLQDYERLRLGFPETPIASNTMAVVVETYDAIQNQTLNPAQAMASISSAMRGISDIRLIGFDWSVRMSEERETAAEQQLLAGARISPQAFLAQAIIDQQTALNVIVEGRVENITSYQSAQDQVINFIDALSNEHGFTVNPLQLPLDSSPTANVTMRLDGSTINPPFRLELMQELQP
ncbi:hypothetical protein [Pseudohongiella spirulinae]|uniref:Uncharacterized protein n=1 Tax=Pseudohongiella spirulinae TaxID=1249552 RepID=A0A0S2KAJ1_9GAMM|nr:hypothetical protein [Pseudohongiella spirulinae]ALO45372.1 hypothetical protein PS2015_692 [Pseudohongiella spirulinae]